MIGTTTKGESFVESIKRIKGARPPTLLRRPNAGEFAIVTGVPEKMPTLQGKLVEFVERPVAFNHAEDEEVTAGHLTVWCKIPSIDGLEYLFRMSWLTYNDPQPKRTPPAATDVT
jgi:hypothetical protein